MNRDVLLAGWFVVMVAFLLDLLGIFSPWDERIGDLQQQQLPSPATAMSSDIAFVDIDDGALERIGRWPWPRVLLADAFEELQRTGARTIAVDLDLSDPEAPSWDPAENRLVDGDARLAEAFKDNVLLSAVLMDNPTAELWRSSGGSDPGLDSILSALKKNITLDPGESLPSLATPDRDAFAANELALKRAALWSVATSMLNDDDPTRDSFVARVVPTGATPGYAENSLINSAWRQLEARRAAQDDLESVTTDTGSPMNHLPLPALIKNAGGIGYVNITHRGADGDVRSIYPTQPIREGTLPALGLAAALHYGGHRSDQFGADSSTLTLPDVELPLHEGAIWIAWPRSPVGTDWLDLLREDASDARGTGHVSIASVVELARARREQERNREALSAASLGILRFARQDDNFNPGDPLSKDLQAEVADEYSFTLADAPADSDPDALAGDDLSARDHVANLLDWRRLSEAVKANDQAIETNAAHLRSKLEDRLVFVGWTATGAAADFIPTVAGDRTPGVIVHAAMADMVLSGHGLHHAPRFIGPVMILLLGIIITLLVACLTPWVATACSATLLVLYVLLGGWIGFSSFSTLVPLVGPVIGGGATWAACTGFSAVLIQRDKSRITRQFRARVSDRLVDTLIEHPDAVSMEGVRREVTVLFADLAGFTSISEQMGSAETVALVNKALSSLAKCIVEQDGYVNKFLGDGLMAFWSAFDEQPDQAALACAAAANCAKAIQGLEQTIGVRLGIATGEAIVGDCGAPPDLNDYTAIGDTVNLAARLESANKFFGTCILIDDTTRQNAGPALRCLPLGPVIVVGQSKPVQLHSIAGEAFSDSDITVAESLHQALNAGDRNAARAALEAMGDHPALDSISMLWAEVIDSNGDLVLRLASK